MNRVLPWIWSLSLVLTVACSKSEPTPAQPGGPDQPAPRAANEILVVGEQNQPLANAKVLIGLAQNKPFNGNYLATDAQGILKAPTGWNTQLPVTIEAAGHIRATFLNQVPNGQSFKLHLTADQNEREIKGLAKGLEPFMKEKDGYIDFAIVSPVVKLQDVFLFNLGAALSPEKDVIQIAGQQIGLPSNLSVPKQVEKYGIFSFTVEKAPYRFRASTKNDLTVVATRARAKVSSLTQGTGPTLVNAVDFLGGGMKTLPAGSTTTTGFDIPADQVSYSTTAEVVAPAFSNTDMMTSMSLAKLNDTQLFMSDIKIHEPGEKKNLRLPANTGAYFVFLWSKKDLSQSQAASLMLARPQQQAIETKFLPMITRPTLIGTTLTLVPPAEIRGVVPAATYVSLSDVTAMTDENYEGTRSNRKWEFYGTEWVKQVQIPIWPEASLTFAATRRWEVLFYGREGAERAIIDPYDFSKATHATRNFVDLSAQ